jgi:hypothetical protein
MSDPKVRPVGDLSDHDGITVIVGVDYDTVTIHKGIFTSGGGIRLSLAQAEEFAKLFAAAVWQAQQQSEVADPEAAPAAREKE